MHRRDPDDLVRSRCDADAGLIQLIDDVATHRVLHLAYPRIVHQEAQRHFQPVIGQAKVDLWSQV